LQTGKINLSAGLIVEQARIANADNVIPLTDRQKGLNNE